MGVALTAVEMTGYIDEKNHLQLDTILPIAGPKRVKVLVLYSSEDEWTEDEWLYAAARNPAFDFLADSREDIYSITDGKPIEVPV
jgi:hypothetical protein